MRDAWFLSDYDLSRSWGECAVLGCPVSLLSMIIGF